MEAVGRLSSCRRSTFASPPSSRGSGKDTDFPEGGNELQPHEEGVTVICIEMNTKQANSGHTAMAEQAVRRTGRPWAGGIWEDSQ